MKVIRFHELNAGALKGLFDVQIERWDNVIQPGWKYFVKDGKRWVTFPTVEKEKDGEKNYYPIQYFLEENKKVAEAMRSAAMKALDQYLLENAQKSPVTKRNEEFDDLPF